MCVASSRPAQPVINYTYASPPPVAPTAAPQLGEEEILNNTLRKRLYGKKRLQVPLREQSLGGVVPGQSGLAIPRPGGGS